MAVHEASFMMPRLAAAEPAASGRRRLGMAALPTLTNLAGRGLVLLLALLAAMPAASAQEHQAVVLSIGDGDTIR
jgi:hypothetical protein